MYEPRIRQHRTFTCGVQDLSGRNKARFLYLRRRNGDGQGCLWSLEASWRASSHILAPYKNTIVHRTTSGRNNETLRINHQPMAGRTVHRGGGFTRPIFTSQRLSDHGEMRRLVVGGEGIRFYNGNPCFRWTRSTQLSCFLTRHDMAANCHRTHRWHGVASRSEAQSEQLAEAAFSANSLISLRRGSFQTQVGRWSMLSVKGLSLMKRNRKHGVTDVFLNPLLFRSSTSTCCRDKILRTASICLHDDSCLSLANKLSNLRSKGLAHPLPRLSPLDPYYTSTSTSTSTMSDPASFADVVSTFPQCPTCTTM